MPILDLSNFETRVAAVEGGYIWSAPRGAIVAALEDIAAGRIAAPSFIPREWEGLAREHGVEPASTGGLAQGSGPA